MNENLNKSENFNDEFEGVNLVEDETFDINEENNPELFTNDNKPRQNYVTGIPEDEIEIEKKEKKSKSGNTGLILGTIAAILGIALVAIFFVMRGNNNTAEMTVKDNSGKYGVNTSSSSNQTDFQGDYQNRYGNTNSNPQVANINTNSQANVAKVPVDNGTVGNITAPPTTTVGNNLYGGQLPPPSPTPQINNTTGVNIGGSSGGNSSNAGKDSVETKRVNPDKNTQIVELPNDRKTGGNGGRNEQVSIYFYDKSPTPDSNPQISKIEFERNQVAKPSFGTVLPIKLLGRLHTLGTNSLVRMELTRTVQGEWGTIPGGTLFVGRVAGGEADRLFVSLIGYIDSNTNRLVALGGDLQGKDGALGFQGEVKKISSRWKKVFGELFNTAKELGSAYLLGRAGGNGTVINNGQLTGVQNSLEDKNSPTFVLVQAGSQGYLVINELPPAFDSNQDKNATKKEMTDEEILKLIQTNSNSKLDKLLPQLSEEGRQIAQRARVQ